MPGAPWFQICPTCPRRCGEATTGTGDQRLRAPARPDRVPERMLPWSATLCYSGIFTMGAIAVLLPFLFTGEEEHINLSSVLAATRDKPALPQVVSTTAVLWMSSRYSNPRGDRVKATCCCISVNRVVFRACPMQREGSSACKEHSLHQFKRTPFGLSVDYLRSSVFMRSYIRHCDCCSMHLVHRSGGVLP